MPLRCIKPNGDGIQSFDLTDEDWRRLEFENRKRRHLRMPCCSARVVFRVSPLGKRYFAHKAKGTCTTAPESDEHRVLKELVVAAARKAGWSAATEVAGASAKEEPWIADVLAEKGEAKVAVEIQWSAQTGEELLQRQRRYRDSSIRCLWLMRRPGFPTTFDVPAVCIGGDIQTGFDALIPGDTKVSARDRCDPEKWQQVIPVRKFLAAAFGGRFRFGVPLNADALVTVRTGMMDCWKSACSARTRIVTFIKIAFGPHAHLFTVPTLGKYPDLLASVLARVPRGSDFSNIARRYSKTQEREYFSNGCCRCGIIFGEHFEHNAWYEHDEIIAKFPIKLSEQWRTALLEESEAEYGWGVYVDFTAEEGAR